jgi:hypothetical protein
MISGRPEFKKIFNKSYERVLTDPLFHFLMAVETTATIILVALTFVSGLIQHFRINRCSSICCDSDCQKVKTPDQIDTPTFIAPLKRQLENLVHEQQLASHASSQV